MSYTRLNHSILVKDVTVTIPANGNQVAIVAPSVSGYTFKAWVMFTSLYWRGYVYPASGTAASTTVLALETSTVAREVRGYALYES